MLLNTICVLEDSTVPWFQYTLALERAQIERGSAVLL